MKQRLQNVFLILSVLAVMTVTAMVACELLLRTGVMPNPAHTSLQLDGETTAPKARLMILADSFLLKKGFLLYPTLVSDLAPLGAVFLNTAEAGAGPNEYLSQFRTHAPAFRPTHTVIFYSAGTDLSEVQYPFEQRKRFDAVRDWVRPFLHRSYLYRFYIQVRFSYFPHQFDFEKAESRGIDAEVVRLANSQKINPYLLELSLSHPRYLLDNVLMDDSKNAVGFKQVKERLQAIIEESRTRGAKPLVVILPSTLQFNRSHFGFYERLGFKTDERTLTTDRPQQALKDFLRPLGVPCLDLLPAFRAHRSQELYLDQDDHMNPAGNRLAAGLVRDFLVEQVFKNK